MTLAVCWLRSLPDYQELVIASDSRTRGSVTFDSCAKIVPLSRGDAVMCYAGDTVYGYPLMLQAQTSVDNFYKSKSRALTIDSLVGHLMRFFAGVVSDRQLETMPSLHELNKVRVEFIIAGFCWMHKKFEMYKIVFDECSKKFVKERAKLAMPGDVDTSFIIAGDDKRHFTTIMRNQIKNKDVKLFDMEPLYIISDAIKSSNEEHLGIGGSIQAYRVYQHMNNAPLPIILEGNRYAFGRKLLDYEEMQVSYWSMDENKLIQK
ncbi:hypothetical protein [Deinococcus phoenicis]|uniref:hypothetical protein n=1 Tax=Deinococcus phoenicis TaxID=1476583 RepID=UPI001268EA39|nr:hypothetical protein [Deinococcus phoenicis]